MTDEQIQRFFDKRCTPSEARETAEYLHQHPEVLEKWSGIQEWTAVSDEPSMPYEAREESWQAILHKKRRSSKSVRLKQVAVAASIAALLFTGYLHYDRPPFHVRTKVQTAEGRIVLHKTEVNRTGKTREIDLIDGSVIKMAPGATIRYDLPFPEDKREISLTGEAVFTVVGDPTRPFTVYAGLFATTALGTEFRVISNSDSRNGIVVKLMSGKVVIRSVRSSLPGWKEDVYLLAGQQLRYESERAIVSSGNDSKIKSAAMPSVAPYKAPGVADSLTFDGTSLTLVMDRLSDYYQVKIAYDRNEIKEMNFSGRIARTDSLPVILKVIAQMNGLEVIPQNKNFIIRKEPE